MLSLQALLLLKAARAKGLAVLMLTEGKFLVFIPPLQFLSVVRGRRH